MNHADVISTKVDQIYLFADGNSYYELRNDDVRYLIFTGIVSGVGATHNLAFCKKSSEKGPYEVILNGKSFHLIEQILPNLEASYSAIMMKNYLMRLREAAAPFLLLQDPLGDHIFLLISVPANPQDHGGLQGLRRAVFLPFDKENGVVANALLSASDRIAYIYFLINACIFDWAFTMLSSFHLMGGASSLKPRDVVLLLGVLNSQFQGNPDFITVAIYVQWILISYELVSETRFLLDLNILRSYLAKFVLVSESMKKVSQLVYHQEDLPENDKFGILDKYMLSEVLFRLSPTASDPLKIEIQGNILTLPEIKGYESFSSITSLINGIDNFYQNTSIFEGLPEGYEPFANKITKTILENKAIFTGACEPEKFRLFFRLFMRLETNSDDGYTKLLLIVLQNPDFLDLPPSQIQVESSQRLSLFSSDNANEGYQLVRVLQGIEGIRPALDLSLFISRKLPILETHLAPSLLAEEKLEEWLKSLNLTEDIKRKGNSLKNAVDTLRDRLEHLRTSFLSSFDADPIRLLEYMKSLSLSAYDKLNHETYYKYFYFKLVYKQLVQFQESNEDITLDDFCTRSKLNLYMPAYSNNIGRYFYLLPFDGLQSRIIIRKDQFQDLEDLLNTYSCRPAEDNSKRIGLALQKMMGSGKTSLLTPIFCLSMYRLKLLPLVIAPKTILKQNILELTASLGSVSLLTGVFVDASRRISYEQLRHQLFVLESLRGKRGFTFALPTFVQSMQNCVTESLYSDERILTAKMRIFIHILWKLMNNAIGIIDEGDTILDPVKELNFPIDAKKDQQLIEITIARMVGLVHAALHKKSFPRNTDEWVALLSDSFFDDYQCDLQAVYQSPIHKAATLRAVLDLSEESLPNENFCNCAKAKLVIWYYLKVIIKSVQSGKPKVEFGLPKAADFDYLQDETIGVEGLITEFRRKKKNLVDVFSTVPFSHANCPKKNSKFADPWKILGFTFRYFLNENIHERIVIHYYRNQRRYIGQLIESGASIETLQQLPELRWFLRLFKRLDVLEQQVDWEFAVNEVKNAPVLCVEIVSSVVFYAFFVAEKQIFNFPLNIPLSMFFFVTFSGTFANTRYFPRLTEEKLAAGKELAIEIKDNTKKFKVIPIKVPSFDSDPVPTVLNFWDSFPLTSYRAIIDVGASFRSFQNDFIAKSILISFVGKTSIVDKVVFAKSGRLFVLCWKGRLVPNAIPADPENDCHYDMSPYNKEALSGEDFLEGLFAYYDQARTVGCDIKLKDSVKGLLIFGESVTSSNLYQAIKRLRNFPSQTVDFAYAEGEDSVIFPDVFLTANSYDLCDYSFWSSHGMIDILVFKGKFPDELEEIPKQSHRSVLVYSGQNIIRNIPYNGDSDNPRPLLVFNTSSFDMDTLPDDLILLYVPTEKTERTRVLLSDFYKSYTRSGTTDLDCLLSSDVLTQAYLNEQEKIRMENNYLSIQHDLALMQSAIRKKLYNDFVTIPWTADKLDTVEIVGNIKNHLDEIFVKDLNAFKFKKNIYLSEYQKNLVEKLNLAQSDFGAAIGIFDQFHQFPLYKSKARYEVEQELENQQEQDQEVEEQVEVHEQVQFEEDEFHMQENYIPALEPDPSLATFTNYMETPEDPATMLPLAFHYLVPEYVGFMKVKHLYASKNYLTTATNDEQHRLLQLPQKAINFVLFVAKSTARTDPFAIFISHREAETFMEEIHFQSTSSYFVMEIYSYQVIARNMIAEDIIKAMQSTAVSVLHFYSLLYSGSYLYIFQNPFFLKLWMSWLYQKNDSTVPAEVEFQRKYKMYRHSLYKKRESDYSLFLEIYGPSLLMPYNPTRELKTADWDKNYAIGMPKDVDPLAHSGPISLMERSDAIKGNLEDRGLWSLSTGVVFDFSPFLEPTLVQAPIFFPMEEEPRDDEDSDDENDGPDSPNNPGKNVVGTTIIFGMFAGVLILNWFFLDVEEDEESLATKKAEEKKQEAAREQAMKEELVKLTDSSLHEAGCAYWPLSFLFIISLLII